MNSKTNLNKFYVNLKLQRPIKLWLLATILLLIIMVAVGGITRLTDSGLSIVEWKPVTGIVPPLSENGWIEEFAKYQNSPEYLKINRTMTLEEFKDIYWWEFSHRLFGRLIGFFFFIPLVYFIVKKAFGDYYKRKLLLALLFGGLQGFVGWFMVKSGLVDAPYVSQYRLALHFAIALIIINLLFWILLRIVYNDQRFHQKFNRRILVLNIWIFIQLISGAFVAGLDAGLIYNTFPLMDGKLIPNGLWSLNPLYKNFFDNITMVQFIHRLNAIALLIFAGYIYWYYRNNTLKKLVKVTLGVMMIQIILGIWTLIAQVPVTLGVLHQLNAVFLLMSSVLTLFIAKINHKATNKQKMIKKSYRNKVTKPLKTSAENTNL